MANGQDILNRMEVLHPELQLQSGEGDVSKGLIAANMAQDYMESVFALHAEIFGDSIGTVTAASAAETTPYPQGLIRLDKLQYLDSSTSLPRWDIDVIRQAGGHAPSSSWLDTVNTTGGAPRKAYTNGRKLFWDPVPDADYAVRWYGFKVADDVTAGGPLAYPDLCLTPLATLAVRFIRLGLDDDTAAYVQLAADLFAPVVNALTNFRRDRPPSFLYADMHDT